MNESILHNQRRTIFAKRLIAARRQTEYAKKDIAMFLNVEQSTIDMWESGKILPQVDKLRELCKLYLVSADWLLGIDSNE